MTDTELAKPLEDTMTERDELTERVVDELKKVARLVEYRCKSGHWDDRTVREPGDIAADIIEMVRADERQKIRTALLSHKALQRASLEVITGWRHKLDGGDTTVAAIEAALAAIGLTEGATP